MSAIQHGMMSRLAYLCHLVLSVPERSGQLSKLKAIVWVEPWIEPADGQMHFRGLMTLLIPEIPPWPTSIHGSTR